MPNEALSPEWIVIRTLEAEDKRQNVEICVSPDGSLFRYYLIGWIGMCESDFVFYTDGGYWSRAEMSGYYDSGKACEDAPRSAFLLVEVSRAPSTNIHTNSDTKKAASG